MGFYYYIKLFLISLGSLSGIIGVTTDFRNKETRKITVWGKIAISVILLSLIGSTYIQKLEKDQDDEKKALENIARAHTDSLESTNLALLSNSLQNLRALKQKADTTDQRLGIIREDQLLRFKGIIRDLNTFQSNYVRTAEQQNEKTDHLMRSVRNVNESFDSGVTSLESGVTRLNRELNENAARSNYPLLPARIQGKLRVNYNLFDKNTRFYAVRDANFKNQLKNGTYSIDALKKLFNPNSKWGIENLSFFCRMQLEIQLLKPNSSVSEKPDITYYCNIYSNSTKFEFGIGTVDLTFEGFVDNPAINDPKIFSSSQLEGYRQKYLLTVSDEETDDTLKDYYLELTAARLEFTAGFTRAITVQNGRFLLKGRPSPDDDPYFWKNERLFIVESTIQNPVIRRFQSAELDPWFKISYYDSLIKANKRD